MKYETPKSFEMRHPCRKDGCTKGTIETLNGQDRVYCCQCGSWQYNAPRTETGRAARTVGTVHEAIKPKLRANILLRSNGRCELCGKDSSQCVIHVGHLISVKIGTSEGLTEIELNDPENLAAMCDECNLGIGSEPLPWKFIVKACLARKRFKESVTT